MKTEGNIFAGLAVFFLVIATIYWFTSYEDAGSVLLLTTAFLGTIPGAYLILTSRKHPPRPEDQADADIADGAGRVGSFPEYSVWPLVLALGLAIAAVGLVFGIWMAFPGFILVAIGVPGAILEGRRAPRRVTRKATRPGPDFHRRHPCSTAPRASTITPPPFQEGDAMATLTEPGSGLLFGRFRKGLVMVALVTLLAGLLFGYDQGVISGALQFIADDFKLSDTLKEVVTSWVTLGALGGALLAGVLADELGRKRALIIAGVLFVGGALVQSLAPGTGILVLGRFVIGLGVGVASVAAPLYAAEMAPAETRGRFVSTYQLAITMGIFIAYIVDALQADTGDWRLMLGIAVVPGGLLTLTMFGMTDTPRWYMKAGRRDDARTALERTQRAADADSRLDAIAADMVDDNEASWGEVFSPGVRRALWVGVGLAVFQQVTGINAIIYYADRIFDLAGFTTAAEQTTATLFAVGAVNVAATFIAVAFVDRFGRRPLLLTGLVGMGVSLTAVGLSFAFLDESATAGGAPSAVGIITLVSLVVYIASFAFSLGPVVWTVISEIYPSAIRGRAVSVATAANWAAAFVVSMTFLNLLDAIGETATFLLFAVLSAVTFVWIARKVPETRGKSLEEIQEVWAEHDAAITSG